VRASRDLPLGAVDASVVALAERFAIAEVATLDRPHYGACPGDRPGPAISFTSPKLTRKPPPPGPLPRPPYVTATRHQEAPKRYKPSYDHRRRVLAAPGRGGPVFWHPGEWVEPFSTGQVMGRRRRPSITEDVRLHVRLDALATTAAMAIANRRGDRARAVAELALAAPGRSDLAGDVAELWRRTGGRALDWPPLDTVVRLLDAARRVMLGAVAMVAPGGWRVVQVTVERDGLRRTTLRVTQHGVFVAEVRSVEELARYVDLATLAEDKPPD
jgi:hypothetical protein